MTFKNTYGIGFEKLALIPLVFFAVQIIIDFAATKFADKIGYRLCVTASQVLSAVGLAAMAVLPEIMPKHFAGILIAVVFYAMGSGLIEVLVSPIIEACPFKNKDGMMSLLHSSYSWGTVVVILLSTLFFALFGVERWKWLTLIWAAVPLIGTFLFITCPIERLFEEGDGMSLKELFRLPVFRMMIILMVCAGAAEVAMSQWASAFTESALKVSKTVGDLAGPCLFAALMGLARVLYSKFSEKLDLVKAMLACGILCVICYLAASLSPIPAVGLAGCALCGLSVGIMWPCTIRMSSKSCKRGGTAMFACLALAGDLGATASPAMVGALSSAAGGLKTGLLFATIFPIILISILIILLKKRKKYVD